jgi:CO dehydrogenase/acetyl-CoA synthase delta subunit
MPNPVITNFNPLMSSEREGMKGAKFILYRHILTFQLEHIDSFLSWKDMDMKFQRNIKRKSINGCFFQNRKGPPIGRCPFSK